MNQEELQQKIAEYFERLPKNVQDVFSSMSWMEKLKEIITKYNLNGKEVEILGTETTLVLLGIIGLGEYQENLEKELVLEKETLEKIIKEIDESILKTIKEDLYKTFESNLISLEEKENLKNKDSNKLVFDPRFSSLPRDVQEVIAKSNWRESLYKISKKYNLNVEQMSILEEITIKVMLNVIPPNNYEDELFSTIKIPRENISTIVKEINDEILLEIRELLKKTWSNSETQEKKEADKIPLPPYSRIRAIGIEPIRNMEIKIKKEETVVPKIPEVQKNIMEEKLKNTTISNSAVSDYSVPNKIITPSSSSHDPYREDF